VTYHLLIVYSCFHGILKNSEVAPNLGMIVQAF
jgi:hypothetical protein